MVQYVIAMSINNKTKSKIKKGIAISLIVLAIGAIGFASYQLFLKPKPTTKPTNEPTKQQSDAQAVVVDKAVDDSGKTPQSYESSDKTDSPSLDGVINFKSVANDMLTIRATINQSISAGTCSLTLTRTTDKKQVLKSAEIVQNPSSATCKGFDVPVSELGSGKWNIVIEVTSGNKTGKISGEITI